MRFKSGAVKFDRNVLQLNIHRLTEIRCGWRHTFKMVAMTSFHAEKCCQLVSKRKASDGAYAAAHASSWYRLLYVRTCFFKCVAKRNINARTWFICLRQNVPLTAEVVRTSLEDVTSLGAILATRSMPTTEPASVSNYEQIRYIAGMLHSTALTVCKK